MSDVRERIDALTTELLKLEAERKSFADQKSAKEKELKSLLIQTYQSSHDFKFPRGMEVVDEWDMTIPSASQSNIGRALLGMADVFPKLADCVQVKIDTKKLTTLLGSDQSCELPPFLDGLGITLTQETKASLSTAKMVDPAEVKRKQDEIIDWAKLVVENPNMYVLMQIETTGLDGYPVAISYQSMDAMIQKHFYVKPDDPIEAGATAVHGIDAELVADAKPIQELWDEIKADVRSKFVVFWSDFTKKVIERTVERYALDKLDVIDFRQLTQGYAEYRPDKDEERPGKWWSMTEMLANERLIKLESPFSTVKNLRALIEIMAGATVVPVDAVAELEQAVVVDESNKGESSPVSVDDIPF